MKCFTEFLLRTTLLSMGCVDPDLAIKALREPTIAGLEQLKTDYPFLFRRKNQPWNPPKIEQFYWMNFPDAGCFNAKNTLTLKQFIRKVRNRS